MERKPVETDPLAAYVFKTVADPFAGKMSIFRVYSGVLKADSTVINALDRSQGKDRPGFLPAGQETCHYSDGGAG